MLQLLCFIFAFSARHSQLPFIWCQFTVPSFPHSPCALSCFPICLCICCFFPNVGIFFILSVAKGICCICCRCCCRSRLLLLLEAARCVCISVVYAIYRPSTWHMYACIVCIYIGIYIYSVGKSSHTYCRLGIAGQPQFSWKYAGFICLTVFYAQPTDAQHDRLCVECVCASICVSGVI